MTIRINLLFQNSLLLPLIYFLLITTVVQGNRRWKREETTEKCDGPKPPSMNEINESIKEDEQHKENSKIASMIAEKAAEEATNAEDAQNQAGAEAALEVKEELAERAENAARAAQAALAGKQAVVDELEKQIKEEELMIKEQSEAQLRNGESTKMALNAVQELEALAKSLEDSMKMTQEAAANAKTIAETLQKESDLKCKLIEVARRRLTKLIQNLKSARNDLDKTMEAAKKAVNAAKIAETNATKQKKFIRRRYRRKLKIA